MNKNEIRINNENKTLVVSKEFMMKAGQFGTPEFEKAMKAKHDFPDYTLVVRTIKRNKEKQTYGNLTYKVMEQFIGNHEKDKEVCEAKLREFELVKEWAKTQQAAYAKVKECFLNEYKQAFQKQQPAGKQQENG